MTPTERLLQKVRALNDQRNNEEVIKLLPDLVLEKHSHPDLYAEKALAHWRLKEYELSNEATEKALFINPNHPKGLTYKGGYYWKQKRYKKAEEYYKKAIAIDPNYAHPYSGLGAIYSEQKDYQKAKEYYKKSIAVDSNYAIPYSDLGIIYSMQKNYQKAEEYYQKAIAIDPNYAHPYSDLGTIYSEQKNYQKAEEYYQKAIAIDPNYARPYNGLGKIYSMQKDYQKAEEYYQKAIAIDPNYVRPYNGLGTIYSEQKDYQKAEEYYKKAIAVDSNYIYPYNNLGVIYTIQKDYQKAEEWYKKAIAINPKFANSHYLLATVYSELKDYNNAIEAYKGYIKLADNNLDYYVILAKSRIEELHKLIQNKKYTRVTELIDAIRDILLVKEGCITHYTSLTVTKALVIDNSLLRLSEGAYLNDTSEGREIFKYLSIHASPKDGHDTVAVQFAQKPFIGSFVAESKHNDLTMWRMYGKEEKEEAKGCAITIDMQALIDNLKEKLTSEDTKQSSSLITDEEFSFYRVAYRKESSKDQFFVPGANGNEEENLNKHMSDLSKEVKTFKAEENFDTQDLEELLNKIAYLFKSSEYQYEHELRLVVKGIGQKKNINSDFYPPRVYIELVSLRPIIRKITLGPKVERADEWAAAFYYSLEGEDHRPDIFISRLPFK
ncbi:tetratricopeptide repeat protein [Catalinimonas niigatensis]|uniref:tetratricopeptide repeat protein n=1 Tax=Catalinimonas niigatensis TaxID=1397264 RepID=UPI002665EC0A|nr:tetratricopeptide repeat protein [Catalinimonas niigatensis]WPP49361.1 tetratricopeptide repeat protein [Catalinimonas niigatensis]